MPALGGVVGTVLLTVRGRRVGWEEKPAGCLVRLPVVLIGAEPSVLRRVHQRLTHQTGECSGSVLAQSPTHRLHRSPKMSQPSHELPRPQWQEEMLVEKQAQEDVSVPGISQSCAS